ncbi:HNH endonuclease signature motif containing protein [Gulosibacter chungangensis]|uniref:DUF222 domain-containing protein n=1 Tax=Gulosibacter chungangensis TaxID=979746 RepID=A0A7J5BB98_9MICO|nr:HNH endonuclease signature motif containing protein [Gulosibacter chungangensis]KAB1643412.1 DUF222 domain-containing protein [Gulosibacter chungangensis]
MATHTHTDVPRANTGRHIPADDIRADEARAKLDDFTTLRAARGAAEAGILRLLASVYEIAVDRTLADLNDAVGEQSKVFSWHFSSLLTDFAIKTNESPQALTNRGYDAHTLVTEFPDWVTSIEAGRIDLEHARTMLRKTHLLREEQYTEYGRQLLKFAEAHTVGATKAEAARLVATLAADAFEQTCEQARAARYVSITLDEWGMARLHGYLPIELAMPIKDLLDKQAKALRETNQQAQQSAFGTRTNGSAAGTAGAAASAGAASAAEADPAATDTRTMDQLRADIFAETLLCATPGESRVTAQVNITIPALALVEGRENGTAPALVNGMEPMIFTEASQLTATAPVWQRVFNHPVTGHVVAVDRYQPTPAQRRFIQIRDVTCRLPGCMRPAARCEIDHTHPASEGGATSLENLASLCKSHHVLKHEKPWTVTNLGNGVLEWRTPLGQVVTSEPKSYAPPPPPPHAPTAAGPEFRPTSQTQIADEENSGTGSAADDSPPPF